MECSTPALLTDSYKGPEQYTGTNQDQYYYITRGERHQVLFTFSNQLIVRDIKLYYYSDVSGNKSLPRVSVHAVKDDFKVWETPPKSRIVDIGPNTSAVGLQNEIMQVNFSSKNLLLVVDQLEHQFYLSEVAFFRCTLSPSKQIYTMYAGLLLISISPLINHSPWLSLQSV